MKNIITIHPTTVTYTDFGDYLDTVHGVTFSVNGNAYQRLFRAYDGSEG